MKEPRKVINHPDWEIYWPEPVTWIGFIVGCIIVIAIMIGTIFLANIGA